MNFMGRGGSWVVTHAFSIQACGLRFSWIAIGYACAPWLGFLYDKLILYSAFFCIQARSARARCVRGARRGGSIVHRRLYPPPHGAACVVRRIAPKMLEGFQQRCFCLCYLPCKLPPRPEVMRLPLLDAKFAAPCAPSPPGAPPADPGLRGSRRVLRPTFCNRRWLERNTHFKPS